nr:RagB/SusD family nutrient uptake outer membrane protein [uncultured Bacteroides sp.]
MKTIKKITFLSILSLSLAGCDLDTKPYQSIDVDQLTPGNVETLTLGTYAYMKSNNGIMRSAHYFGEYGSDNLALSGSTTDPLMNIYNYLRTTNNSRIADIWSYSYKTIININATLEVAPEGESKEFDMIIGENYYLRAFHYFTLVNVFGQPYINNPETNLGVPIKLTTSLDDFPERATVKEVYEQIEKDLLKAIELMTIPEGSTIQPKNSCYASKEVAEALLSRVYLYMENWEKVLEYTNNVINSGRYSLLEGDAYKSYPTFVPEENSETIFAVRYTKDVDYLPDYRPYMIGSMYAEIDNDGWGEMYPSDSYLRLLDLHPEDLRQTFIHKQTLDNGNYWFIYTSKNNTYVKVPVSKKGDSYTIIDPTGYQSAMVTKESYHGGTAYTVTAVDGTKYYGRVEEEMDTRNDYPKYYIYKCSLQEGQAQLWSPIVSRLAEMYLNRAEAKFHLNDLQGALDDVNIIRDRAGIPEWTLTNLPEGMSVLDVTLEERRMELAFEAQRRFDIYRNRLNLNRNYPGGHISSGGPTTVKYNEAAIVEYIPQSEMLAYPNQGVLVQNP